MSASRLPTMRGSPTAATQRLRGYEHPQIVLGRYRLAERLGAGAFGTVWAARDERLGRDVAVKIVPRERIVGGRFEREARAAARLAHPAIVTLYEAAVDDHGAYLVSELVRGGTLADLLQAGLLSDRDIVAVSIALCDALAHAHGQGIVHRDVKPSNVLIPERPTSASHPAKLTDFGVARVIGGDSLTRTGDVVGTAAYMAPEQAEGREAGPAADLYSVALVAYEALTGVNPVRTGTAATRARRLGAYLPPLRRQRRDLPRELGRGIDLALRPRPRERGSLAELQGALLCALPLVQDIPGVVGGGWRAQSGGTRASEAADPHDLPDPLEPFRDDLISAPEPVLGGGVEAEELLPVPRSSWRARGLAALATATVAGWLAAHALSPSTIAPGAAGLAAAGLALALPRIGWLATISAVALAATGQGRPGAAVVVLAAGVLPMALLLRRGCSWSLPAAAPALGMIGLAGAWPAIAARAPNAWRRAALGLTGWVWLLAAAPLAGEDLVATRVPVALASRTPAPNQWTGSVAATLHHVLSPILTSGVLAAAPVWALGAVVLPWLVRGRSLTRDVVAVSAWAATMLAGTEAAIGLGRRGHVVSTPGTVVLGALAGALVALSPALRRAWRLRLHAAGPRAQLP